MSRREGRFGRSLCVWTDLLVGGALLVAPVAVPTLAVPGGTLAGAVLVVLGGYDAYRLRTTGGLDPVVPVLGVVVGAWLLTVPLVAVPNEGLRRWVLLAGVLVVVANALGYVAATVSR